MNIYVIEPQNDWFSFSGLHIVHFPAQTKLLFRQKHLTALAFALHAHENKVEYTE
jgi:hypothetical protein